MSIYKNYLKRLGIISFVLMAIVVATNWFIDPYHVYASSPRIHGINFHKFALGNNIRLHLASDILKEKFDVLVLGASTAEGLPTSHPYYKSDSVYRLAIAGSNSYEMLRYFQHAEANNDIKHILILADFFSFNAYRRPTVDFREDILDITSEGNFNPTAQFKRVSNTFSIDTFIDSIETITTQPPGRVGVPANKIGLDSMKTNTPLFDKMHNIDRYHIERGYLPPPHKKFSFDQIDARPSPISNLEKIIKIAKAKGIRVDLVISPSHARALGVINVVGIWDQFENWKRILTLMASENDHFTAWDFSGFHPYALDPVPAPGEQSRMIWYRDQIHFREPIGQKILDRMDGGNEGFGVMLKQDMLDEHLKKIQIGLLEWKKKFPRDANDIETIAKKSGLLTPDQTQKKVNH
ncbi:MAG: hypothetical protein OQK24_01340 [Magnetovibrio sp.]|nr:hypothetical protein [Magnetovibrio sp.]